MTQYRIDLENAGIPYEDDAGCRMDFHALRTTFSTLQMRAGVSEFVRMKLMRVNEFELTQKTYMDASMIPFWDAIVALEKMNDTQIDALKSVESGKDVSTVVSTKGNEPLLLAAGDQTFSPSESASVRESLKEGDGARCRVRTCNTPVERQGFASTDTQIDTQDFRHAAALSEIRSAWPHLADPLRAAILGIVGSCRAGSAKGLRLSRPARPKGDKRSASVGRKTTKRSVEDVLPEPRGPRGRGGERPLSQSKILQCSNSAVRKNKHRKQKGNK